jgi:HlyD family secretion protein
MISNKALKYLLISVAVLAATGILSKQMGWIGGDHSIKVAVEKAAVRTIIETVGANGKIQPEVEVKISSDVSGEIVELPVKEGEVVKKGQLLVRINPDIYEAAVQRIEAGLNTSRSTLANTKARLAQAESQFEKAKSDYERAKKLFDGGAISTAEFEASRSAFEVAKSEVEAAKQSVFGSEFNIRSAEASLKEARDNLGKTSIYAPVNGTISKLSVEKGERVVGTSQMSGTEMMRLANLSEMEVSVDVNENDIVRVKLGDTSLIEVDAYLDKKFKGIVTEIANSANIQGMTTDQVTNFMVKIRILSESYADLIPKDHPGQSPFRPGMSATVEIQTRKAANVLTVPIQAVATRDTSRSARNRMQGSEDKAQSESAGTSAQESKNKSKEEEEAKKLIECVFVIENGKAKIVPVKSGIQDNTFIEVISGLKDGQEVITAPYSALSKDLKEGAAVKVVPKNELFTFGKEE